MRPQLLVATSFPNGSIPLYLPLLKMWAMTYSSHPLMSVDTLFSLLAIISLFLPPKSNLPTVQGIKGAHVDNSYPSPDSLTILSPFSETHPFPAIAVGGFSGQCIHQHHVFWDRTLLFKNGKIKSFLVSQVCECVLRLPFLSWLMTPKWYLYTYKHITVKPCISKCVYVCC